MTSKEKVKKGGKKWDSEDVIQAVVIADSFNFRFLPLTTEKPRALLPLVNRPLIDYTVEFLAVSGVEEVFVYCCAHADAIRTHFIQSRWMRPSSPIRLHIIVSENCPSVGDALRDIDSQALIKSDFVLVSGDLVSNMELREVIQKHKKLREMDKMTVMTNVYKRAAPYHRTRSTEDDILIVADSSSDRLLYCEKPAGKKRVSVPTAIFEENKEVDIHYDVLDCHISICSPNVPQLFSDNFDYQTRYHFIRGIIVNEEVLGNYIYAHFISDQYAARVSNLQTYEAVTKDVIYRWVYPLVPDNSETPYSYGRHNLYLGSNVSLAFDCVLEEDVVLGSGTIVGASARITHSSIGQHCNIGKGVVIDGCYIWDDVTIGDNCKLSKSIIASNVELKEGVVVEPGCILSFNVVVGQGFCVANGNRLTTNVTSLVRSADDWDDDSDQGEEKTPDVPLKPECVESDVGCGGKGFKWDPPQPDSDDDSGTFVFEKWYVSLCDEEVKPESDVSSVSSRSLSPNVPFEAEIDAEESFYVETLDCVRSGVADSVPCENTILMINASKHAYNIPIRDVPRIIAKTLLEAPAPSLECPDVTKPVLLGYITKSLRYHRNLLLHYVKGTELQIVVINVIAEAASKDVMLCSIFAKIVLELYNLDIVEEGAIFSWHEQFKRAQSTKEQQDILKCIKPVIEWLENAEEETDEDDN